MYENSELFLTADPEVRLNTRELLGIFFNVMHLGFSYMMQV